MSETTGTGWPRKFDLFGVGVSATTYDEALEAVAAAASAGRPALVAHLPVHGLVSAAVNRGFRGQINAFDIVAPDGQPVRWALRALAGVRLPDRVYGPEFMLRACERAAREGLPVYLYGGSPTVAERLASAVTSRWPALKVAGCESPPFRPLTQEEDREAVRRINESGARLLFVGLGCPKQERFAYAHRDSIRAVQVCVGAAFDFHAGAKKMAPAWMQRNGLEWLHRLTQEPLRLGWRYLWTNALFLAMLAAAAVKRLVLRRP